jgi:hypothetical protein
MGWVFLGFLVLIAAICFYAIYVKGGWRDRAFMQSKDNLPLIWPKDHLPLQVLVSFDLAAHWRLAILKAVSQYNDVVGRQVFMNPAFPAASFSYSTPTSGAVIVRDDNSGDPKHGVTMLYPELPPIDACIVTLPEAVQDQALCDQVALHEFGHVLGLAHDEIRESIMWPTTQGRAGKLTDYDIKNLKWAYA